MTDPQENKFSMYRVAEKLLDDNNIIWNGTPAFVTTKTAFSGKITAIFTASQQQQAIITGIATDKKVLKTALIETATPVAAAVIAFASQTNNNELLNAVNFTHTQLLQTRDDVLSNRCQTIHDKANDNLAALAAYGITAPVLTTLQNSVTAYNAKVPAPGTAKQTKKTATINLVNLFKETDVILKMQLDKLMLPYKTTSTDFYNNYIGAREIIDLGATHTKIQMLVKDESGNALQDATASLLQNNLVIYFAQSGTDGKLTISKIKPGTYDLKTEKQSFQTKTETGVKFKAGKAIKRTVILSTGSSNPGNGTAVREGDVMMGGTANIDLNGINGTPSTRLKIDVSGSPFRVYAAANIGDMPGPQFVDVQPNMPYEDAAYNIAAKIGMDNVKKFVMVQNIGATQGHYKFNFSNLEQ